MFPLFHPQLWISESLVPGPSDFFFFFFCKESSSLITFYISPIDISSFKIFYLFWGQFWQIAFS